MLTPFDKCVQFASTAKKLKKYKISKQTSGTHVRPEV